MDEPQSMISVLNNNNKNNPIGSMQFSETNNSLYCIQYPAF